MEQTEATEKKRSEENGKKNWKKNNWKTKKWKNGRKQTKKKAAPFQRPLLPKSRHLSFVPNMPGVGGLWNSKVEAF